MLFNLSRCNVRVVLLHKRHAQVFTAISGNSSGPSLKHTMCIMYMSASVTTVSALGCEPNYIAVYDLHLVCATVYLLCYVWFSKKVVYWAVL